MKNRKLSASIVKAPSGVQTASGPYGVHTGTARLGRVRVGFEVTTPMIADAWMPDFARGLHGRQIISHMPASLRAAYRPLRIGPWVVSKSGQIWDMSGILQFKKVDNRILTVSRSSHIILGAATNSRDTEAWVFDTPAIEDFDGTGSLDLSMKHDCMSEVLEIFLDRYDDISDDERTLLHSLFQKGSGMSNDEAVLLAEMLDSDDWTFSQEEIRDLAGIIENCRHPSGDEGQLFDAELETRHFGSGANVKILTTVLNHLFFWLSYPASYPYTVGRANLEEASFYRDYFVSDADEFVERLDSAMYSRKSVGKSRLSIIPNGKRKCVSWYENQSGIERNFFALDRYHVRAEIHFQGVKAISAAVGADAGSRQLPLIQLTRYSVLPTLFALTDAAMPYLDDLDDFIRPGGISGLSAGTFERIVLP